MKLLFVVSDHPFKHIETIAMVLPTSHKHSTNVRTLVLGRSAIIFSTYYYCSFSTLERSKRNEYFYERILYRPLRLPFRQSLKQSRYAASRRCREKITKDPRYTVEAASRAISRL